MGLPVVGEPPAAYRVFIEQAQPFGANFASHGVPVLVSEAQDALAWPMGPVPDALLRYSALQPTVSLLHTL